MSLDWLFNLLWKKPAGAPATRIVTYNEYGPRLVWCRANERVYFEPEPRYARAMQAAFARE